ncbi:hypothetical protein [Pseudoalteromonas sp. S16_S37]|uniref:hypothetical protein n=1 Tax=Pseudoalteromonas sp. S16_S37 TaxID=2720228 RepID=UPI00168159E5|nr:hypothetical protein [Pseudoalteromonas sp. S16_S37]MBD1581087.1 hypothetical protein [Pseudoalteromonas sp. S16_S37]
MAETVKVKNAFTLFSSNLGQEVEANTLEKKIGWKKSTINTYFNKKWKGQILTKVRPGVYKVVMDANMNFDTFSDLHTQVDKGVR